MRAAGTTAARDAADRRLMSEVWRLSVVAIPDVMPEPKNVPGGTDVLGK